MSTQIRGVYRNGVVELAEPLEIAEGAEVYVTVPRKLNREERLKLLFELREKGIVDFDPKYINQPVPDIKPIKIKGAQCLIQ